MVALVAENNDEGAGWVDERRPIISLVASAVLGLLPLLEDRALAAEVYLTISRRLYDDDVTTLLLPYWPRGA